MATSAQARRWAKTGATQQRILDAATEIFATRGFSAATMADVVAGSGASIGSIYHHFGGKNELFLAIFKQMANAVDRRIEAAMEQAGSQAGTDADPRRIFEIHVRAYLDAMWENRRLARVLTSGDTPAGFEVVRRDRMQAAFRSWMAVLELDKSLRGQVLGRVLVATMAESSLMVAGCENPDEVPTITDATIELIARLTE
jgi:AcrR family transcriptional regulator